MESADNYSFIDRLLHRVAFDLPGLQRSLAELEDDWFAKQLEPIKLTRPVFVAGLPRSGTTLLLESLYACGEFSTFTYRQMPFLLAPLIWQKISAPFLKQAEFAERAHGDGVIISFDSPEAFEEVIWLSALRNRIVTPHALNTLSGDDIDDAFRRTFRQTVRKLLCLDHNADGLSQSRYLSKNNANISRLKALDSIFDDAIILVPFRDPFRHAQSLKTQHERFLQRHVDDAFSRKYMAWIGHYDFGQNFKPIAFTTEFEQALDIGSLSENFWLRYWIAAYRFCLQNQAATTLFVDFDQLLESGTVALRRIAEHVAIENPANLLRSAEGFRQPNSPALDSGKLDGDTVEEALALHEDLRRASLD